MNDQVQRPTSNEDREGWSTYWTAQGMLWRTEPEIDEERQRYLAQRQAIQVVIEKGIFPFRDENVGIRLTRADLEWLLATHESRGIIGPVIWDDEKHKPKGERRTGLDLRGADLRNAHLSRLPLAALKGGLWTQETSVYQLARVGVFQLVELAAIHLEWATLADAHLEGAVLTGAHLEGAFVDRARLENSNLDSAHLKKAYLYTAHLEGATLADAHLEGANLERSRLGGANLEGAQLGGANLFETQLDGADLSGACLRGAYLVGATFDKTSRLNRAVLAEASFDQVSFDNTNLLMVDWSAVSMLGDERQARKSKDRMGKLKKRADRLDEFRAAVRANRVLVVALREQGLNDDADRFAYRAQVLQRQVLRRQRRYGVALGSWLLDLISGHGYKPMRSLIAYVLIICAFAGAYLLNAQFAAPHLTWDEALVLSISAFHGRGFFTSGISLGDTLARLAAGEAIIGLLIEITFIATFTQRFFAR